ncbi:unnamed protein product [Peronospora destructor]|uniref:DNA replication regulator Sld3 C-terminal domain-containing protein n=1 Tax=Peronospora destructor TaxID=86335 RepID=A0AAV0V6T1_9STRA|nr:unnamed protein product [Peronospora destructor]
MVIDWKKEYGKTVALEEEGSASAASSTLQQINKTRADTIVAFLDLLLMQEGGEWWIEFRHRGKQNEGQKVNAPTKDDKKQLVMLRKRLAAVGNELLVQLPELTSSKETPRSTTVRVLQLQLVFRMLRFGTLTSKKKEEKKQLKKEIRGLLDRVALLLDTANPPSLADEDADELSPFQEFLRQKLSPRLEILLPGLMQYLLRVYELEEEDSKAEQDVKGSITSMLPMPVVKLLQPPPELSTSAGISDRSILSALRQERPAKRARLDASGLFNEVELPHQKQILSYSRKSRRVSKSPSSSANKCSTTNRSSSCTSSRDRRLNVRAGAKSIKALGTTRALSTRLSDGTHLLCRAAATTATASERSHFAGRQTTIFSSPSTATQVGRLALERISSPLIPGSQPALCRKTSTSSVVMRTPDRPKRLGTRSTRRVLVEASPPLHRPNGAGASVPRLLQPKSSRLGTNPPPLFG